MNSGVFIVHSNHPDDSFCVGDTTICQKEYLLSIAIHRFPGYDILEGSVYLCSSKVGRHAGDFLNSFVDLLVTVFYTIFEQIFRRGAKTDNIEVGILR